MTGAAFAACKVLAAIAAACLAAPALAGGGQAATASGNAQATVIEPMSVRQLAELDFGIVESDPAGGGSVSVSPASDTQYGGMVKPACDTQGDCPQPHAAQFSVRGEPGRSYGIEFPASLAIAGVAVSPDGEADAPLLTVVDMAVRTSSRPDSGPEGKLGADGQDRFELGGTLQVPANLGSARYATTVDVVVSYR